MRLAKHQCESCGGTLSPPGEGGYFSCSYCATVYSCVVDENGATHVDLILLKEIQADTTEIRELTKTNLQLIKMNLHIEDLKKELEPVKKKYASYYYNVYVKKDELYKKLMQTWRGRGVLGLLGLFFGLYMLISTSTKTDSYALLAGALIFIGGGGAITSFSLWIFLKKKLSDLDNDALQKGRKCWDLEKAIEKAEAARRSLIKDY